MDKHYLDVAIGIARDAHAGQTDKGGAPYILHPLRVMGAVRSGYAKAAAVLHDVLEDSDWTVERLADAGIPTPVINAVFALTRIEGETYDDFIRRVATDALATEVKLADLEDNMNLTRIPHPTDEDRRRLRKYERAWSMLSPKAPSAAALRRLGDVAAGHTLARVYAGSSFKIDRIREDLRTALRHG